MTQSKKGIVPFQNSTRHFDDLMDLLDAPIIKTATGPLLTSSKPFTPAQQQRKLKQCFKTILDTIAYTIRDLEAGAPKKQEQLLRATKDNEDRERYGNALVIKPSLIIAKRRQEVLALQLNFLHCLFKEVLGHYERQTGTEYKPDKEPVK
jgi:hypothetical protein